jgi:hypothetical protein
MRYSGPDMGTAHLDPHLAAGPGFLRILIAREGEQKRPSLLLFPEKRTASPSGFSGMARRAGLEDEGSDSGTTRVQRQLHPDNLP